MSVLLIFGAGASFGNPDCSPEPPPLGARLFEALQKWGSYARTIDGDIATVFRQDFELGMLQLYQRAPGEVGELVREMASYFAQFEPGPSNYYHEIARLASKSHSQAVIATTNYDLLIEHALTATGARFSYTGTPVPSGNIALLKIHGSANFLPAVPPNQIAGLQIVVPEGSAAVDAPVRPARSTREIIAYCEKADVLAPALALYMRGKPVLHCPTFIRQQQRAFHSEIVRARRVIVVGLRVVAADDHIWAPLARTRARVDYVGLADDSEAFEGWSHGHRGSRAVMAHSFAEALPFIRIALRQ